MCIQNKGAHRDDFCYQMIRREDKRENKTSEGKGGKLRSLQSDDRSETHREETVNRVKKDQIESGGNETQQEK